MTPADSKTALLEAAAMQWPDPAMQFNETDKPAPSSPAVKDAPPALVGVGAREALERAKHAITKGMEL